MNIKKKKSILITHPLIARDWDAEKNIDISIENVAPTDKLSVWWSCLNGHSYSVSPYTRLRTNGCKYCNKEERGTQNRLLSRLITGNSKRFTEVADKKLLEEWALDLNDVSPREVTSSSNRKVNWRCIEGHVWLASISARMRGTNCPKCYSNNRREILLKGKLKISGVSLFEKHPALKDEWDFQKNSLDPQTLTPNSNYKVYWKCRYGHGWDAAIYNRTANGSGCPFCTNQTSKIEIYLLCELREIFAKVEWRKKIDGVEADIFLPDLNIVIEVDGEYWHRDKLESDKRKNTFFYLNGYKTIRVRSDLLPVIDCPLVLFNRNDDNAKIAMNLVNLLVSHTKDSNAIKYQIEGIPKGESNYKVMISRLPAPPDELSLLTTNPDISTEWDYEKNKPLTPDLFSKGSNQILWWKCNNNHSWQSAIKNRALRNSGCPICYIINHKSNTIKKFIEKIGSFENTFPELMGMWDYEKNIDINPSKITSNVNKTYAWKCSNNHSFERTINSLLSNKDCPICNSISKKNIDIAVEWDYTKNIEESIETITSGSGKPIWWICRNNHSWQASPQQRINDGKACPACLSLGFKFPKLLDEWNYGKNTELDPKMVHAGSKTKVWWKCNQGHEWFAEIGKRSIGNRGCPKCSRIIAAEKTRLVKLSKSGSLKDNFPEIATKWNRELNKDLTPNEISPNSHTPVWWTCNCGNYYKQTPNHLVTLLKRGSSYKCEKCS